MTELAATGLAPLVQANMVLEETADIGGWSRKSTAGHGGNRLHPDASISWFAKRPASSM